MAATVEGIHLYGDYADIPAAGDPPVGSLYSATDQAQIFITDGSTWTEYASLSGLASLDSSVAFIIDGGSSAITTGVKGFVQVPFDSTITSVTLLADQTGSIVVDIWNDEYANFPPTDADSITGSAVPTISSAVNSTDATLTGWTTAITAGDILAFNVDSVATVQRVTVSLAITRV
jgi:hypothetical protein